MSKIIEDTNNNLNSQSIPNNSENQEPNLMNIIVGSLTPLIPVVMAKLTGQKLPVSNPIPNEQATIQQLTPMLQSMINTQNLLLQEIILLKKNDQSLANSFQNLRLTHEKKSVELNTQQNSNDYE